MLKRHVKLKNIYDQLNLSNNTQLHKYYRKYTQIIKQLQLQIVNCRTILIIL